jgi:hypothetical protein
VALLIFPSNPVDGQLYPTVPVQGTTQYQWDAAASTWRSLGVNTGVTAGTFGDAFNVAQITVNSQGKITMVQNVEIAGGGCGVVSVNASGGNTGLIFTGGPITYDGTLTLGGILDVASGGTGTTTLEGLQAAALPDQSGQGGNYLTTDGTTASWAAIAAGGTVTSVDFSTGTTGLTVRSHYRFGSFHTGWRP